MSKTSDTVFSNRIVVLTMGGLFSVNAVSIDGPIVAIPDIARAFAVSPGQAQMTAVLFLLGYALAHIPVGLLGDRYGRRPVILSGLVVALLTSLLAVFAPSFEVLLAARFIQGMATCCAGLLVRAMVRDVASGQRASQITSNALACLAVLIVIAPLLSGLLLSFGNWRYVLALVSFYLVGILALTITLIPETMTTEKAGGHPWQQFKHSWNAFFHSRQSILASVLCGLAFGTYFIFSNVGASIFKDVYDLPGWVFGLVFSASAIAQFFSARMNAKQVSFRGSHIMLRLAAGFGVLGIVVGLLCYLSGFTPLVLFILVALSFAISHGIVLPNSIALALDPLPKSAGFAAAIHGSFQSGLASLIGIFVSSFYDQSIDTVLLLFVIFGSLTMLAFVAARAMLRSDHLGA